MAAGVAENREQDGKRDVRGGQHIAVLPHGILRPVRFELRGFPELKLLRPCCAGRSQTMLLGEDPMKLQSREAWTTRQNHRMQIVGTLTGIGAVTAFGIILLILKSSGMSSKTGVFVLVIVAVGAGIGMAIGLLFMKKIVNTPPGAGHLGSANLAVGAMAGNTVSAAKNLGKKEWKKDWIHVKGGRVVSL